MTRDMGPDLRRHVAAGGAHADTPQGFDDRARRRLQARRVAEVTEHVQPDEAIRRHLGLEPCPPLRVLLRRRLPLSPEPRHERPLAVDVDERVGYGPAPRLVRRVAEADLVERGQRDRPPRGIEPGRVDAVPLAQPGGEGLAPEHREPVGEPPLPRRVQPVAANELARRILVALEEEPP